MQKSRYPNGPRGINEWIANKESPIVVGIYPRCTGKTAAVLKRAAENTSSTLILVSGNMSQKNLNLRLKKYNVAGDVTISSASPEVLRGRGFRYYDLVIIDDPDYIAYMPAFKDYIDIILNSIKPKQLMIIGTISTFEAYAIVSLEGPRYTPKITYEPKSNILWFIQNYRYLDVDIMGQEPFLTKVAT